MSFSSTVERTWRDNRLMSVLLELTYACNLDCVFCYNDTALEGKPLSFEQYVELLEDVASLGVLNVTLSGGEPLAHPRFFDIASHARRLGFVIRLKTNGHAVKEPIARRIREEIDPFMVEVSLHGATAAVHDRQTRVAGSFGRLVANVRTMKALGMRVRANSVLTRWNEHEVDGMIRLCNELDVALQIDTEVKPKDDGDLAPLALESTPEGRAHHLRVVAEWAERVAEGTSEPGREPTRQPTPAATLAARGNTASGDGDKHCGAGSNTLAIDPFGNVLPCVQWRVPVGNLHEQRLAEIWAGAAGLRDVRDTTKAVRRELEAAGYARETARFCPGAAHTHHGDPLALYPAVERRLQESGRTRVRLAVV